MKLHYVIILMLLLAACKTTSSIESSIFTKAETAKLNTIIDLFESTICQEGTKDYEQCYTTFGERFFDTQKNSYFEETFTQTFHDRLSEELGEDLFKEIWFHTTAGQGPISKQDTPSATVIEVSPREKYAQFLKEVAEDHESIGAYESRLQTMGSISPTMVANVYQNLNEFDLADKRIRLILAVHYITLIDQALDLQKAS
ncbi:MAG: hypothetical protein AAFO03_10610 [Bacteroidota bacterium]